MFKDHLNPAIKLVFTSDCHKQLWPQRILMATRALFQGLLGFFLCLVGCFLFWFSFGILLGFGGRGSGFFVWFFLLLFALAKFLESTPVSSEDWLRTCKSSVVKGERKGCSWSAVPYASSPPSRSKIAQTSLCLIVTFPD